MKLIVGLGNPGTKYEKSRHNTGWRVIDALVKEFGFEKPKKEIKFKALVTDGIFNDEKIILAKPTTYMNLSGEAVAALVNFYKIKPDDLWLIYDDLDLPLGQIRIRKDGGPGTHNGMKSVIQSTGLTTFPRFRVGIESRGVTAYKNQDTADFVLASCLDEECQTAAISLKKTVKAILTALEKNLDLAMNEYNS